jgi:acyl carrier protein
MTSEITVDAVCATVERALLGATKSETLSAPVTAESRMGAPKEWDSLSFVSVFLAISCDFDIELDDDDAIHFQSIKSIKEFLIECQNS